MSSAAIAVLGAVVLVTIIVLVRGKGRQLSAPFPAAVRQETDDNCKRCGRRIEVDPDLSRHVFEGMHWLCFHLEFEHSTDPDLKCTDIAGCPWWTIQYYEDRLRQLGLEPTEVTQQGMERQLESGQPTQDG